MTNSAIYSQLRGSNILLGKDHHRYWLIDKPCWYTSGSLVKPPWHQHGWQGQALLTPQTNVSTPRAPVRGFGPGITGLTAKPPATTTQPLGLGPVVRQEKEAGQARLPPTEAPGAQRRNWGSRGLSNLLFGRGLQMVWFCALRHCSTIGERGLRPA